jgi:hypothetical protein
MRKTILLGAFGTLICLFTTAQKLSLQQFKNWKPRNIGPAGMVAASSVDVVLDNEISFISVPHPAVYGN